MKMEKDEDLLEKFKKGCEAGDVGEFDTGTTYPGGICETDSQWVTLNLKENQVKLRTSEFEARLDDLEDIELEWAGGKLKVRRTIITDGEGNKIIFKA